MNQPRQAQESPPHSAITTPDDRPGGAEAQLLPAEELEILELVRSTRQRAAEDQQLLAAIVNSSEDAIVSKTPDDIITSWNPGAERIFGYTSGEAIGKPSSMLLPPERLEEEAEILACIMAGESVKLYETVRVRKDGKRVDVAVSVSPIVNRAGKIIGVSKIARDITQRKQSAEEQRRTARLLELSYDAVFVWQWDGAINFWNRGAEMLYGYSAKEAIGQEGHRLLRTRHPQGDMKSFLSLLEADGEWNGELIQSTRSGQEIFVDSRHQIVQYSDGRRMVLETNRDITETKRIQAALRASQALYLSLVEQMPAGLFRKDARGRYVFVNSWFCKFSHTHAEQYLGKTPMESVRALPEGPATLADINARELAERGEDNHETIMRTGQTLQMEERHVLKNGQARYLHVTKTPVFSADGKIIGSQGVLLDITERKLAEEENKKLNAELEERVRERTAQLTAANHELEAFSYSVSHDLRSPLRAVNGFAGIVLEDYGPHLPPECRSYLERIRDGGQRMGCLIDDLLAFARLSRQPVLEQPVEAADLVKSVLDELKLQFEGRPLEITMGQLPACHGDPTLLRQVWLNLLSNALKYTRGRQPAKVEIGVTRAEGKTTYFVRDNGAGFDMRYADKLFGVFQRLHRAEQFEGSGVGLAIVQRIVHRHGGEVWAEGQVDRGATFYFTLAAETPP